MDAQTDQTIATHGGPEAGVVASSVYSGGRRIKDIAIEDAGEWSQRPGHVVWIGLFEPSTDLLRRVQRNSTCTTWPSRMPARRISIQRSSSMATRCSSSRAPPSRSTVRIAFGETHLFVGPGYVVSVRHGASISYAAVRERCESCPAVLSHGEDYILYAILDFIVDNYTPVLETLHAEVEEIEDTVFSKAAAPVNVQRLYMIRRDLLRLRNAVVPLVEVCRRLEHAEVIAIDAAMQPLFRDVTDHVLRVQEEIDSLREVLAFAFEASLMTGQAQQTAITRKLAAWAAILAVPTAIAGIYGMNFEHMPELKWRYGYFLVIAVIAAICGSLYWRFHRNGWV